MVEEPDNIDRGEDAATYSYNYLTGKFEDGRSAACADCGGTGTVQLLVTVRPCKKCGGTGMAGRRASSACRDDSGECVPGHWVTRYAFDDRDELIGKRELFVPDEGGPDARPAA